MRRAAVLFLALVAAGAARAEPDDFVTAPDRLSDEAFYRLVACGAPPGEGCVKPMARWVRAADEAITVALAAPDPGFPGYRLGDASAALDDAIAQIAGTGAAVPLVRLADGAAADITVFLSGAAHGETLLRTGFPGLDGQVIAGGLMTFWAREGRIERAGIALSRDLPRRTIRSVLLEELVQALGLATDVRGPAYLRTSIFDEDSNTVTRLDGQDAEAVRRHYPAPAVPQSSASR